MRIQAIKHTYTLTCSPIHPHHHQRHLTSRSSLFQDPALVAPRLIRCLCLAPLTPTIPFDSISGIRYGLRPTTHILFLWRITGKEICGRTRVLFHVVKCYMGSVPKAHYNGFKKKKSLKLYLTYICETPFISNLSKRDSLCLFINDTIRGLKSCFIINDLNIL